MFRQFHHSFTNYCMEPVPIFLKVLVQIAQFLDNMNARARLTSIASWRLAPVSLTYLFLVYVMVDFEVAAAGNGSLYDTT